MEIDLKKRLAVVRQNVGVLQAQRDIASQEVARLDVLILKHIGAVEYLESLKTEQPKTNKKEKGA